MRVFLLDASVWDPVAGALRAVRITDAVVKTVWGGALYEQLLVRPPSIRVEVPWDGDFSGGSRTSVDEIEILMPFDFDWLARLDWVEATIRLRSAEDGAADAALADYGTFTVARMSADERALRLILKDWQAELTKPFLGQYDGTGGLNGEPADKGSYIPAGWGRVLLAPAQFIDRANLVMRFDRGPAAQVDAVRQRGILIPIAADLPDLAALNAAVIPPGECVTCRALGLVRFRFTPGEPVTVDYRGSTSGGYVERLPEIATRVAAEAGLSVDAASVSALSASIPQPGGLIASGPMTPAQAFDLLLAGVRGAWAIRWDGALVLGRIDFSNPVDLDADILSVEVSKGSAPSWEHTLGYARNWRPLADGELAEGITSADIAGLGALASQNTVDYATQVGGAGKPALYATRNEDAGNLIPDPISLSEVYSSDPPFIYREVIQGGNPGRLADVYRVRASASSGTYFGWTDLIAGLIAVSAADTVYFRVAVYIDSDAVGNISLLFNLYGGSKNYVGTALPLGFVLSNEIKGQWKTYSGSFVVPNNVSYIWPHIGQDSRTSGFVYFAEPYVGRVQPGATYGAPGDSPVGTTTASALVAQAASASANSLSALATIAGYSSDSLLTPLEKGGLITAIAQIDQEYARLEAAAAGGSATVSGSAQRAAATSAYNALKAFLASLSPAWNNRALDTPIVRATYDGRFGDYRFAVQNLANLISADAATRATWSSVVERPAELVDGTVIDTRNRASRLRTNGRGQGNLLPTGNNSGATSVLTTTPISGLTSTSVTIASHTRYILGRAVTYNGGTISGLNPSTRYHIYADDPDELGGSVGYLATTDFSIISGENRIYFGPVTTAAAGNPGGGGGGGAGDLPPADFCVDVAMFVGPDKRAGSVELGDLLWSMDDAGTPQGLRPVCSAEADLALCQCLATENRASVVVSWSAPLWTLNRGIIRAIEAAPGDVVMTRVCNADVLSPLVGVEKLGWRGVRKIHIQGISYAAGTTPDAMIYTHNPTYKP